MIYAVGDVHGRLDMLTVLVKHILEQEFKEGDEFVFVGDYVDRGPDSKGVLDYISNLKKKKKVLKGNHEDMMIDISMYQTWMYNGGKQTLASYGDAGFQSPEFKSHVDWLKTLPLSYKKGKWFFVHAGVDPGRKLDEQSEKSMLWIREEFLNYKYPYENNTVVVHGHTPIASVPTVLHNRINLDTGACFSGADGRLTAAVLSEDNVEKFLQVHQDLNLKTLFIPIPPYVDIPTVELGPLDNNF